MKHPGQSWLSTGDRGSFVGNFRSFLERLGEAPEYNEGKLLDKFQAWEIPEARVQVLSNTLPEKKKEAEKLLPKGQVGLYWIRETEEMRQLKRELLKGTLYKNLVEVEAWETEADELMDEFIKKKLEKDIGHLNEFMCAKLKEIEAMQRQKEKLQSQLQEKNRQMIFKLKEKNRVMSDNIEDLDRRYREQKVVPKFQTDRVQQRVLVRLKRAAVENMPETIPDKNDSENGSESGQNQAANASVESKRSTEAEQGNDAIQKEKNQEKQQVVSKRLRKDGQN